MSEVRLVALVRDIDGEGEAWIRPLMSVDWHEAFAFGITEAQAFDGTNPDLAHNSMSADFARNRIRAPFKTAARTSSDG